MDFLSSNRPLFSRITISNLFLADEHDFQIISGSMLRINSFTIAFKALMVDGLDLKVFLHNIASEKIKIRAIWRPYHISFVENNSAIFFEKIRLFSVVWQVAPSCMNHRLCLVALDLTADHTFFALNVSQN